MSTATKPKKGQVPVGPLGTRGAPRVPSRSCCSNYSSCSTRLAAAATAKKPLQYLFTFDVERLRWLADVAAATPPQQQQQQQPTVAAVGEAAATQHEAAVEKATVLLTAGAGAAN